LSYRVMIFAILGLAYFFVYFHRLSLSVVADDLARDFNIGAEVVGLMGAMYFWCYAVMQLPAGLLSDSLGPRRTVTLFLSLAAVGSVVFGLAPNAGVAMVGRVLVGLGVSMVFIPTMKTLSQWFRVREFAMMAGILNAIGGVAVLAATWFLALMTGWLGWRFSFQLIGGITLLIVVLIWIIVRDNPAEKGWPSVVAGDPDSLPTASEKISLLSGLKIVLTEGRFWPLAIWFFLTPGAFFAFGGLWGGPYLMHVYGLTRAEAGAVLSMIAWGMVIGSPMLGYISDKIFQSRKLVIVLCSIAFTAVTAFLNIAPQGLPVWALYLIFFIFSVSASSVVVVAFTTTKELFPVSIAGTSVGCVNLFPFLGGAVLMWLLGVVLDIYGKTETAAYSLQGYKIVLAVLLASAIIALICSLMLKETFPTKRT
jgi:sugar phosphate permease